jgi:hypothetical protein
MSRGLGKIPWALIPVKLGISVVSQKFVKEFKRWQQLKSNSNPP